MNCKCKQLVDNHTISGQFNKAVWDVWQIGHYRATRVPNSNEAGIWAMINAFAALADSYAAQTEGERLLGQDGYYHEHAQDLVKAMRAYLNFDVGRFDCGTLDQLICDLAAAAGVELEP